MTRFGLGGFSFRRFALKHLGWLRGKGPGEQEGSFGELDALDKRVSIGSLALSPFERESYEKIVELVPTLAQYKASTLNHVRKIAEARGFSSFREYYQALVSDEEELAHLSHNLTLKGTHFFRGEGWDTFDYEALASLAGRERVRVWCAGCSSGEEVFSTLLCLKEHVSVDRVEVLATDYDDDMIEKLRVASYARLHRPEIPDRFQDQVVELNGGKRFTFDQSLRDTIESRNLNLLTDEYPAGFDVIVCRNVIKFFSLEGIADVVRRLVDSLVPGGYLFLAVDDVKLAELIVSFGQLGMRQLGESGVFQKEA